MKYVPIACLLCLLVIAAACGGGSESSQEQEPPPPSPPRDVKLTQLSTDTFSNAGSQHATEVEAGSFAFGSTIVTAFQVGRIFSGGAADIGFAISTDQGRSWTNGYLPGITVFEGGGYDAVSDPAVAFDVVHGVWLISSLSIKNVDRVVSSRSADGTDWEDPVIVSRTPDSDKNWIACDNGPSSPFRGHCYTEWDDPSNEGLIWMSTSTDGGLSWGRARNTADQAAGIGGQPVVQPNGTVVVPIEGWAGDKMLAFISTDGGASWQAATEISKIADHLVAGDLRTSALPSAGVDAAGTVYVVWQDCRFRTSCASNDMILSTSSDGVRWSSPTRIPIDPLRSGADHFIPGLAVDPSTSGSFAHLALTYYFYPVAACALTTCDLKAGFIASADGGSTWSKPTTLAGPMATFWLPNTFAGFMVGDYASTVFSGGKAFSIIAIAGGNAGMLFNEPMFATTRGFTVAQQAAVLTSANERPVRNARADHARRSFYDQEEHRYPIRPPR